MATGEVTQAVRDTASPAGPIEEGDWIGLVRGDGIVAVGPTVEQVSIELLDQLVGPGREIVTIVTGVDADGGVHRRDRRVACTTSCRRSQVEIHHGGQPLYPFLFGVE